MHRSICSCYAKNYNRHKEINHTLSLTVLLFNDLCLESTQIINKINMNVLILGNCLH